MRTAQPDSPKQTHEFEHKSRPQPTQSSSVFSTSASLSAPGQLVCFTFAHSIPSSVRLCSIHHPLHRSSPHRPFTMSTPLTSSLDALGAPAALSSSAPWMGEVPRLRSVGEVISLARGLTHVLKELIAAQDGDVDESDSGRPEEEYDPGSGDDRDPRLMNCTREARLAAAKARRAARVAASLAASMSDPPAEADTYEWYHPTDVAYYRDGLRRCRIAPKNVDSVEWADHLSWWHFEFVNGRDALFGRDSAPEKSMTRTRDCVTREWVWAPSCVWRPPLCWKPQTGPASDTDQDDLDEADLEELWWSDDAADAGDVWAQDQAAGEEELAEGVSEQGAEGAAAEHVGDGDVDVVDQDVASALEGLERMHLERGYDAEEDLSDSSSDSEDDDEEFWA